MAKSKKEKDKLVEEAVKDFKKAAGNLDAKATLWNRVEQFKKKQEQKPPQEPPRNILLDAIREIPSPIYTFPDTPKKIETEKEKTEPKPKTEGPFSVTLVLGIAFLIILGVIITNYKSFLFGFAVSLKWIFIWCVVAAIAAIVSKK